MDTNRSEVEEIFGAGLLRPSNITQIIPYCLETLPMTYHDDTYAANGPTTPSELRERPISFRDICNFPEILYKLIVNH